MKVCSICHRQYADSLKFCLDDGTVLSKAPEPPVTLVDPQATLHLKPRETDSGAAPKGRSPIIWLALGGIAVVLIVGVAVVIALVRFGSTGTSSPSETRSAQTAGATPAEQSTANVEKEIERANDEVVSAMLHSDPDALSRLLADEYRYVSDVGLTLNKLEVLALIRTGNLGYEQLTIMDSKIEVNKEMNKGELTGRSQSKGQLRRQPFTDLAFYRNAFEKRDGRWQLVSETVWHRQ
jgi:flagellar basal body-associated protein FliL